MFSSTNFFVRLIAVALALTPCVGNSAPVRWVIQTGGGSGFWSDGGRVVGSFIYDADTRAYSNIALTTFGGSYPGDFYTVWDPSQDTNPGRTLTAWVSTSGGLLGQKEVYFPFIGTLTNTGGLIDAANYIEGPCAEIGPHTGGICLITQSRTGFFTTFRGTPLPVPGAVWLLASALGVLGWVRRRRNV